MDLIRTKLGVTDVADEDSTRFAEEIIHKSPSMHEYVALELRKDFKRILADEEVVKEEFNPAILWPVPFATTIKQISEKCDDKLVKIGEELAKRFYLYTSKALSELYCRFSPAHKYELMRVEPLDHFIEVSSHAVKSAILNGGQAVISRFLEFSSQM